MGLTVAAVYVGLSLGPFLGGLLTQAFTWRSVFALGVPFSILAFWVSVRRIRTEWADARGERFDLAGSIIYGLALIAVIQGLALLPGWKAFALMAAGLAGLVLFIWWEGQCRAPVFQIHLFRTNRTFAFSSLAALINYCATYAVTFLLSLYLQQVQGLSPRGAGFVLIAQPIMMALLSPLAGRLSDLVQPRIVASCGMALTAIGLGCLALLEAETSQAYIVACLILNGIGFGVFSSPNMNAIMSSVEKRYYGIAAGAVASMRILGQMTSMGIAASVIAIYVGHTRIAPDNHPALVASLKAAFIIFGLLCVAGVFASLSRGRLPAGGPGRPGGGS